MAWRGDEIEDLFIKVTAVLICAKSNVVLSRDNLDSCLRQPALAFDRQIDELSR